MNWTIEFFPFVSPILLWGGAVVVIVASVVLMAMRRRGVFLRSVCFGLLLLVLVNPHLKQEQRQQLENIVLVVLDDSNSQRVADRRQVTQLVRKKLEESFSELENVDVQWVTTRSKGNDGAREKDGTFLFSDLKRSLSEIPRNRLAGIILVTDGQVHDIPKNVELPGVKVPVHMLLTGSQSEFDQRIEIVQAPRFGLVGSQSKMKLRVVQYGDPKRFTDGARVRIKGENGKEDLHYVTPGVTIEVPIRFPHAGANFVEVELEAAEGELTEVNNRVAVVAQGVRENLRVLLVSGEPHAGERTWRNLLKSDASVDLVHFTILRPPEKQDGTPINQLSLIAFPTRELFSEKLGQFDLIIFDRYRRRGVLPLLYLDNIARYVEKGGAILVAAGSTYSTPLSLYGTPLAQILPAGPTGNVIEQPYRAKVTEAGRRHPVTRNLPGDKKGEPSWGRWFRLIQVSPKQGDILMKGHGDNPLLILNRLGKGRVALLVSDHAWLWARGYDGGGPHLTLLRRLAHWLMKEPDLEEEFLGASVRQGELIIERRSMKDDVEKVRVQYPDGRREEIELEKADSGIWRKTIKVEMNGLYRFSSGKLTAIAHTGVLNSQEMSDVAATDTVLKPLMEQTGGGVFWPVVNTHKQGKVGAGDISLPRVTLLNSRRVMHGEDWMAVQDRKAYKVLGVVYAPVLNGLLTLLLIAGLIMGMWYREGR